MGKSLEAGPAGSFWDMVEKATVRLIHQVRKDTQDEKLSTAKRIAAMATLAQFFHLCAQTMVDSINYYAQCSSGKEVDELREASENNAESAEKLFHQEMRTNVIEKKKEDLN